MPGLLQTGQGRLLSFKFFMAFAAEFLGKEEAVSADVWAKSRAHFVYGHSLVGILASLLCEFLLLS